MTVYKTGVGLSHFQATMKFSTHLLACLVAAGSAVALVPLTSSLLRADITSTNLLYHANQLEGFAAYSSGVRSHGTLGYNYSVDYFKTLLDNTGFYDTELLPVTSYGYSFTSLEITDSDPTSYYDFTPLFGSPAGLVSGTYIVASNVGCTSVSAQVSPFRQAVIHIYRAISRAAPQAKLSSSGEERAPSLASWS